MEEAGAVLVGDLAYFSAHLVDSQREKPRPPNTSKATTRSTQTSFATPTQWACCGTRREEMSGSSPRPRASAAESEFHVSERVVASSLSASLGVAEG
jgi:hypothetical protein